MLVCCEIELVIIHICQALLIRFFGSNLNVFKAKNIWFKSFKYAYTVLKVIVLFKYSKNLIY